MNVAECSEPTLSWFDPCVPSGGLWHDQPGRQEVFCDGGPGARRRGCGGAPWLLLSQWAHHIRGPRALSRRSVSTSPRAFICGFYSVIVLADSLIQSEFSQRHVIKELCCRHRRARCLPYSPTSPTHLLPFSPTSLPYSPTSLPFSPTSPTPLPAS